MRKDPMCDRHDQSERDDLPAEAGQRRVDRVVEGLPRTNHELFDKQAVKVVLKAGSNKVSLKLNNRKSQSWGAWCFACVARLSDGTILPANADQQSKRLER